MPRDGRRRARFGLRERLVAALVLCSVVTLVAAAFALLSPLEHRLTADRLDTLSSAAAGARSSFTRLPASALRRGSPELRELARVLRRRTGAEVAVFDERGRLIGATEPDATAIPADVREALRTEHPVRRVDDAPDGSEARVSVATEVHGRPIVIVLTKSLRDEHTAVGIVQSAFVTAALIGLAAALVLGIGLATGLVRRLEQLRRATIKVAELGPGAELAADPYRDEVGDLTRSFAAMQERLRDQEQARRAFVSTASHELRTPLASLGLMLDMLEEDLAGDDPDLDRAREEVGRARGQADRLSKLAAELLDLSRIDARAPLREELVDLREISRAVIAEFAPGGAATVRLDAAAACWAVADPGSVARIVRILVDNALRFTPDGEHVTVAVGGDSGRARIRVSDTGPGVPDDERELIFERFRRGSETGSGAGFGLGLAIGRELARRMGGDLTLAAVPAGACFELALPPGPEVREDAEAGSPAGDVRS
jgi:signal transduction histidine kinase